MIQPQVIQQIIETARIDEVIGDFLVLKRRGTNLITLCPFHNEKTPSFHVSPGKGIYKCFGCGKAGNAVNFIMEHEHYTYPEALKYLAKKYNIEIEETEQSPEDIQLADERESLYNLLTFAQKYFSEILLNNKEGKAIGKSYFEERGFSQQTISKFQLGYCLDKWEEFSRHATESGYKSEYLVKSGLCSARSNANDGTSGSMYDTLRGRVIFPIHNLSGRVIGFGGRILSNDKTKPKYINSPETEIYHKSDVLYGIWFAKNAIIKKDNCCLVEGYTDVISLHQSGIENVVASSGTSLTTGQIKLIKRYTSNITILYDGDAAGIKASFRGIDMILQEGLNVRVVLFPDGEDPDSFARKNRPQELIDFISNNSSDFISFKTGLLLKETGDDPVKKSSLIKEILNSISLIPDVITRTEYIKECGRLMSISEQTLINELNRLLTKNAFKNKNPASNEIIHAADIIGQTNNQPAQIPIDTDIFEHQEKEIIRLLLLYGDREIVFQMEDPEDDRESKRLIDMKYKVADYITANLNDDLNAEGLPLIFNNPVFNQIFNEFLAFAQNPAVLNNSYFVNHHDEKIRNTAIDILTTPYTLSKNWQLLHKIEVIQESDKLRETIKKSVLSIKLKRVDSNIAHIFDKLKLSANSEDVDNCMKRLYELKNIRNNIASELTRIVIK